MRNLNFILTGLLTVLCLAGCAPGPVSGPDKQFTGTVGGAMTGAGAGAITGFQVGAAAGPGAAIGAGFGAVAGGIQGYLEDANEENLLKMSAQASEERKRAWAQDILAEHYKRRIELHPTRDIYPADLFFRGDDFRLRAGADMLVEEIARLNMERAPWSALVVVAYVKAGNPESEWAKYLAEKRSKEIGNTLVRYGIEARRIKARATIITEAILKDPHDRPERYSQAVEIIPVDR